MGNFFLLLLSVFLVCIVYFKRYSFLNLITPLKKRIILIDNVSISVEIAEKLWSRNKGLSGRHSLGENEGMFFIFPEKARYQFRMPQMHFPIDIVWIDGDTITGIIENISPLDETRKYVPETPVDRVLEVRAGFTRSHRITKGMEVLWK